MKKLILLLMILFSVTAVFGQSFKPVKVDSLVTISMPSTYIQKDTLGQHIFSASSDLGYMVTIVQPNARNNQPLKKENDLNDVLQNYIKGIQVQSGNGSAQDVRDTTVGTLKAKAFTLVIDDGSGSIQYRNFLLIYTKDATYTLQYVYPDMRKDLVRNDLKSYFGSIKLSPELQRNDQYTDIHSTSSSVSINSVIVISAGILLVFLIVWLVFLRNRGNELA